MHANRRITFSDTVKVHLNTDASESKTAMPKQQLTAKLVDAKCDFKEGVSPLPSQAVWANSFLKLTIEAIKNKDYGFVKILLGPRLNHLNQRIEKYKNLLELEKIKQTAIEQLYHFAICVCSSCA